MAARDYYIILGVAPDETEQGVRAAFRDLAKRHHPDQVGPQGAAPFREVAEAYQVLGDPSRRRQYDESRKQGPAQPRAERLVREVSTRRDRVDVRPSQEALVQRIQRNVIPRAVPIPDRVDELTVDVAISPEEAGKGALLRIGVPVFARCSRCGGRGCIDCEGAGTVGRERAVAISLPPMTGRGTRFVVSLAGLGVHNSCLHVRVRVDQAAEPRSNEPPEG